MCLEEAFECHTGGLSRLFRLPVQEPRALADECREFSSFRRAPILKDKSSGVSTTSRKAAPSTRAGSLQLNWPGSSGAHGMMDCSDGSGCPRIV